MILGWGPSGREIDGIPLNPTTRIRTLPAPLFPIFMIFQDNYKQTNILTYSHLSNQKIRTCVSPSNLQLEWVHPDVFQKLLAAIYQFLESFLFIYHISNRIPENAAAAPNIFRKILALTFFARLDPICAPINAPSAIGMAKSQ